MAVEPADVPCKGIVNQPQSVIVAGLPGRVTGFQVWPMLFIFSPSPWSFLPSCVSKPPMCIACVLSLSAFLVDHTTQYLPHPHWVDVRAPLYPMRTGWINRSDWVEVALCSRWWSVCWRWWLITWVTWFCMNCLMSNNTGLVGFNGEAGIAGIKGCYSIAVMPNVKLTSDTCMRTCHVWYTPGGPWGTVAPILIGLANSCKCPLLLKKT